MIKVLFEVEMVYHLGSLLPFYRELSRDSDYDIRFHLGKNQKRVLGFWLISERPQLTEELTEQGFKLTDNTQGFDLVISGDALNNPAAFGNVLRISLDHGVGIKTSRIRNIIKQSGYRYQVFLEGQFWFDYIKKLGWQDKADFHVTGSPKLDPLFWDNHFNNDLLLEKLQLNPHHNTVLFAPSYKPSCIKFIGKKIFDLIPHYNLIIKLHPYSWRGKYAPHSHHRFFEKLVRKNKCVHLIPEEVYDIYPYLYLADTLISDTSSVINEFLALGRFGIICVLPQYKRKHSDGMETLAVDPQDWFKDAYPH
ncbi:MAG: CDP-glycerol glycerophosphotransferase family protein, partial [Candidatus Cloacimonetes bacterium]|nr:CDP-glycerol glycerophosphotransferase family protein [Candidatus Cloacimonadota bacterium]